MPDVFVAPHEEKDDTPARHRAADIDAPVAEKPTLGSRVPFLNTTPPPPSPTVPTPVVTPSQTQPVNEPLPQPPVPQQQTPPAFHLVQEVHTTNIPLFASFWQNPQGVYFDTQEANEHILLFLRRHWITNLPWLFSILLFSLLPIGVFYLLQYVNTINFGIPAIYFRAFALFYYLLLATYAFLKFLSWYYNISLITPKRVLDIELADLVYKKISATKISLVQDINYEQVGTIRSIFNYGDVLIQTAGTEDNFYVHAVPHPEVVVRIVENIIGGGKPFGSGEENEK